MLWDSEFSVEAPSTGWSAGWLKDLCMASHMRLNPVWCTAVEILSYWVLKVIQGFTKIHSERCAGHRGRKKLEKTRSHGLLPETLLTSKGWVRLHLCKLSCLWVDLLSNEFRTNNAETLCIQNPGGTWLLQASSETLVALHGLPGRDGEVYDGPEATGDLCPHEEPYGIPPQQRAAEHIQPPGGHGTLGTSVY